MKKALIVIDIQNDYFDISMISLGACSFTDDDLIDTIQLGAVSKVTVF